MGHHDALRTAGGARRVDHVGGLPGVEVRGLAGRVRRGAEFTQLPGGDDRHPCQGGELPGRCHDHGQLRLLGDVAQPLLRIVHIHRHVGAAGLQHPEQRDDQPGVPLQADPDPAARGDALRPQSRRHLFRRVIELPVCQLRGAVAECRGVGPAPHPLLEQPDEVTAARADGRGAPRPEDAPALRRRQQFEVGHRARAGALGQLGREVRDVGAEPLGELRRHRSLVEPARAAERAVRLPLRMEGEREDRGETRPVAAAGLRGTHDQPRDGDPWCGRRRGVELGEEVGGARLIVGPHRVRADVVVPAQGGGLGPADGHAGVGALVPRRVPGQRERESADEVPYVEARTLREGQGNGPGRAGPPGKPQPPRDGVVLGGGRERCARRDVRRVVPGVRCPVQEESGQPVEGRARHGYAGGHQHQVGRAVGAVDQHGPHGEHVRPYRPGSLRPCPALCRGGAGRRRDRGVPEPQRTERRPAAGARRQVPVETAGVDGAGHPHGEAVAQPGPLARGAHVGSARPGRGGAGAGSSLMAFTGSFCRGWCGVRPDCVTGP